MDIQSINPWLIVCGSPRARGNSEHAAALLAGSLRQNGLLVETVHLRDYAVEPCVSCGLCISAPGACALDPEYTGRRDDTAELLTRMRAAAGLVIISPIYFYGLPAHFKGLVDRSQRYWSTADTQDVASFRPAFAAMPAGRARGEHLFDGSLLTLRSFLRVLGFSLRDHLPLRGLDGSNELAQQPDVCRQIQDWGSEFARQTG